MMHAADYSNMNMQQMSKKVDETKKKDKKLSKGMKYVFTFDLISDIYISVTVKTYLLVGRSIQMSFPAKSMRA